MKSCTSTGEVSSSCRATLEDGDFLKVKEVDRESAINWCMDNKLPEWDFRPLFGLWD